METIQKWLQDPKDYFAGIALYATIQGCKPVLLANLKKRETAPMREKLKHELKQYVLQNTEKESKAAAPLKKVPAVKLPVPEAKPEPPKKNPKETVLYHQLPAELRPALLEAHNLFNEMCLLKAALNDLLQEQESEALELQLQIHALRKKNELRWSRIDYWKQHKKIPAAAKSKNEVLNAPGLVKKQQNLFSSISRLKKRYQFNQEQMKLATTLREKSKLEKAIAKQAENLLRQEDQLIELTALIDRKDE
jgi:hypothetical protein